MQEHHARAHSSSGLWDVRRPFIIKDRQERRSSLQYSRRGVSTARAKIGLAILKMEKKTGLRPVFEKKLARGKKI